MKEFSGGFKSVYKGPVFAVQKVPIRHGALGGKIVSHFEQGRAAAGLASKILSGVPSGSLRVVDKSPNLFLFDHNELERFNLKKAALPSGAKILNAPVTILDEYAHWVVGGILVFVLQLGLILVLFNTMRQRRLAEMSLRESDFRFMAFFDNSPSIMYMKDLQHRFMNMLFRRNVDDGDTIAMPLTEKAEEQLNDLMGDIDGLLDGTNSK